MQMFLHLVVRSREFGQNMQLLHNQPHASFCCLTLFDRTFVYRVEKCGLSGSQRFEKKKQKKQPDVADHVKARVT